VRAKTPSYWAVAATFSADRLPTVTDAPSVAALRAMEKLQPDVPPIATTD